MYRPLLYLTKSLAVPLVLAAPVLGLAGLAQAQTSTTTTTPTTTSTTTTSSATPPPDQITLTGSCLTVAEAEATADQAMSLYVDNGPPAGLILNGTWVPAGLASSAGAYLATSNCATVANP